MTTYKISVQTGGHENSDTRANVYVKLFGEYGNSDQLHLRQSETKRKKFQQDQVDLFTYQNEPWLGKVPISCYVPVCRAVEYFLLLATAGLFFRLNSSYAVKS